MTVGARDAPPPPPAAVAARLVVGLAGPALSAAEAAWLAHWRPAGVILFRRNVTGLAQVRALAAAVRERLGEAAEIAVDHEGGPVSVLADAIGRPPSPWGLGRLDDPDLTRRVHAETAARLRGAGATRVLGPCADVLVEPHNPVIGARAFGADPQRVADHVAAAVTGLRAGGLDVCLKHWPGHGGTRGDSHAGPVATGSGALDAPFVAGLAAGADAVMVGHLPDPRGAAADADVPATLAPAAQARLRGLAPGRTIRLFADDLTMGGLGPALAARGVALPPAEPGGLFDSAVLPAAWFVAVADAGCDRLLVRGIPWQAFPAAASGRPGPPPVAAPAPRGGDAGPSSPAVYGEAWRRLAAAAGGRPFPPGTRTVAWLDDTAGDRWGSAQSLVAALAAPLRLVPAADAWAAAPAAGVAALLVTSHRPLNAAWLAGLRVPARLASAGGCLAVGHPALAADLRAVLPPGWRLMALTDFEPALVAALTA